MRLGARAGIGLAARDDDLRPGRDEPFGDRPPDPPRPSGDDRDATAQVEQRPQFFLVHEIILSNLYEGTDDDTTVDGLVGSV